jgi:hypothetical protein
MGGEPMLFGISVYAAGEGDSQVRPAAMVAKVYDRVNITVVMDCHGSLEDRLERAVDDLEKELGQSVAR